MIVKYSCFIFLLIKLSGSITVPVEYPKGSNNFIEKDLIEFINDGKRNETIKVSKNAIMILGLSGTGKSTLV